MDEEINANVARYQLAEVDVEGEVGRARGALGGTGTAALQHGAGGDTPALIQPQALHPPPAYGGDDCG